MPVYCFECIKMYFIPLRGRHQSSIYPDNGEEWHERTEFVIFSFIIDLMLLNLLQQISTHKEQRNGIYNYVL